VKDVDLERGEIVVRDGKGGRHRVTMLPVRLVPALAAQLERVRGIVAKSSSICTAKRLGATTLCSGPALSANVRRRGI